MIIFLTALGGVGYVMLAAAKSVGARYAGVFLAAGGIFPAIANILPWTLSKFFHLLFINIFNKRIMLTNTLQK